MFLGGERCGRGLRIAKFIGAPQVLRVSACLGFQSLCVDWDASGAKALYVGFGVWGGGRQAVGVLVLSPEIETTACDCSYFICNPASPPL